MTDPVFLGIDAGTTKIKAALVNLAGNTLGLASRDATVRKPTEGWCEMDMDALWQALCGITQELRETCGSAWDRLAGLGITAQGDGLWAIDQDGRPVRPAILWNDTRVRTMPIPRREEIDRFLVENHGTPLVPGALPYSLWWVKHQEPDTYSRIATVFHCKDWLNFCLTDQRATDHSDGSNSSVNVLTLEMLPPFFDLLGMPEAVALHPPMLPSAQVMGQVSAKAAAQTGLPAGLPVITGAIDVAGVALGAGVTQIGDACTILGTTLCNEVLMGPEQVDHRDTHGSALCSVLPGCYVRVMAAISGTSSLDWAKSVLAPELSLGQVEEAVSAIPVGANGILYHPYLYGERAPFKEPFACGGFYGLNSRHTRFDMLRAVYEGLILSLKDCHAHLPVAKGRMYVSGGGSQSNLLCQLIADALDREVVRPSAKELGIQGIVAAVKVGLGITESYQPVSPGGVDVFTPNKDCHRRLEELYATFVELRGTMTPYWAKRARSQELLEKKPT